MNKSLLTLTLAALSAAGAGATDLKVTSYPEPMPVKETPTSGKVAKAPLNQQAKRGLQVFGVTAIDYMRSRSYVNYYQNEFWLERLSPIASEAEVAGSAVPDLHRVDAGAYNMDDGYYYAYKVKYYTIGTTYAYQWVRVDPVTGEWTVIKELEDKSHLYTPLYDMAYSPYDGEMWGLIQSTTEVKSRIGIVNLANSEVTDIIDLNEYYYAIAFDYEGTAYGVRWTYNAAGNITGNCLDTFNKKFEVVDSKELKIDGKAFLGYYQHGLAVDYTTGDLIWAATDGQANQRMVRINPETAETENLSSVGFNECMLGLYVPYVTADSRKAPAIAKNLEFVIDPNGENAVTINWTNATTLWNRAEMTDLQSVKIYRDDLKSTPIATLDATGKEGQDMSYEDTGATPGIHTYYVVGVNAAGNGVPASIEAFVGKDTPGPVRNISLTTFDGGHSVTIKWDAPETGDSEGWFDTNITYKVTRLPDNYVLTESTKLRSINDKDISEAQFYSYIITPSNEQGVGTPVTSDGILAGASVKIPFATSLNNQNEAARFPSFDMVGTANVIEYAPNNQNPGTYAMRYMTSSGNNNVTLATPPLDVTEGKHYRVIWKFSTGRYGHSHQEVLHHFSVIGGDAPRYSALSMLEDFKDFRSTNMYEDHEIEAYFEAPYTGDYYVGLNILSNISNWTDLQPWIYVTGFQIEEVGDNDLMAELLTTPAYVSSTADNVFRVKVRNLGLKEQSNYKVEVGVSRLDGKFLPFAETDKVPTLKSRETAEIIVMGYPEGGQGLQDLVACVTLEGDEKASNDQSPLCEIKFFEGDAFNFHAVEDYSRWVSTTIPLNISYDYSATQTYYTPSMIGLEDETNDITGFAWEYHTPVDIRLDNLKVWIAKANKETFSAKEWDNSPRTLVFDGAVDLPATEDDWMRINFIEKFTAGPKDILLVSMTAKETGNTGTKEFPLQFNVWNSGSANLESSDGLNHSLCYYGNMPFDFTQSKCYPYCEIPALHFAVEGKAPTPDPGSVDEVALSGLTIEVNGKVISLYGNPEVMEVFDVKGAKVFSGNVAGESSVTLPVAEGIYIVKLHDAAGRSKVVKAVIR